VTWLIITDVSVFILYALQGGYDSQQSSYLAAMAAGSSGYGTIVPGYGQYSGESSAASSKYANQSAYYQQQQAASGETPSYYTR